MGASRCARYALTPAPCRLLTGNAGEKKKSNDDKKWGKDKAPGPEKDEKLKKSKGRSLELNETLATIAHLYAGNERNEEGIRTEKINKKDFYRIFGEVIWLRQQLEVFDQLHALFSAHPASRCTHDTITDGFKTAWSRCACGAQRT